MSNKINFLIICIIFLLLSVAAVCANEDNSTVLANDSSTDFAQVKDVPTISLKNSKVYTGKDLSIQLKDSNSTPISNQNLAVDVGETKYNLLTDKKGTVKLNLNLTPGPYVLNVSFLGNENYAAVNQTFNVDVLKLSSNINPVNTTVFQYKYFCIYLKDNFDKPIKNSTISYTIDGKSYSATTGNDGKASLKISLAADKVYSMKIYYSGDDYYQAVSKTVNLLVPATTSIVIGNDKLLTNGYLRVYLKSYTLSAISKKTIKIKIGSKSYTRTTNSEGAVIFKPKLNSGNYIVTASFAGSSSIIASEDSKKISCIVGNTINPLKEKIPLVNGSPDIDVMPANYVMGDGDMKYTLLKSQYKNVIQRDSYYLYLKNKLSKYVYFKTKSEPKLNHIIVREKWNVIERTVITKIVLKNKHNYWPGSVTVSLKGKSYSYSQVRDVQDTGYTCGPTSGSMCSQFLKRYVCEKQLAKLSGSTFSDGTTSKGLKKGLEKCGFKCSYFYKSSFDKALNQLKKGGCALVFHTWGHYVAILDISADGKKVLVGNPSGDYDKGSHDIPTNWLTVDYMKNMFNNYDTSSLIVKLKYSLSSNNKNQLKNSYSSMGSGWVAKNTDERIPQI